jgi:hypothetical protein
MKNIIRKSKLRNIAFVSVFLFVAIFAAGNCFAAQTKDYAVQISAAVQTSPAKITLSWVQDTAGVPTNYTVSRKLKDETSWNLLATLSGDTLTYDDTNVSAGSAYEYRVIRTASDHRGYGYIYAGIDAPLVENRGKVILMVDNSFSTSLASELETLQQDLIGDGWQVIRHDVSRTDTVPHIKSIIKADYDAGPSNVKSVFLFGHIPVPYSGDLAPDGHGNHIGAWPADAYYADMVQTWTDTSVNDTQASDTRNKNIPGDGKFDQTVLYSTPVKLQIGRVDLSNMTSLPGNPSELDLLRRYLAKDYNFRHKIINPERRGLIGDNFGVFYGEAFAAGGWRNFSAFFGPGNVSTAASGQWIPTLKDNSYLWSYGCGGGNYTSAGGVGDTTSLVTNDVKTVFTMLFGSYFGDWDSPNNFLRSPLAAPTYGLTNAWSGRPDWVFHHMALGETIGYSTRLTQNNLGSGGLYSDYYNSSAGYIHVALMGDPTLRMHIVAPVSNLTGQKNGNDVLLNWSAASDSVVGYNIYRSSNSQGPFTRLNSSLVSGTSYTNPGAASGNYTYMVRAIKKESTTSGTYFNASEGIFLSSSDIPEGISSADLNQDTKVDLTDFNILKADFLKLTASLSNPRSDINGDGQANIKDVGILMSRWSH